MLTWKTSAGASWTSVVFVQHTQNYLLWKARTTVVAWCGLREWMCHGWARSHPSVPSPCHGSITGQNPAPPAPPALMKELLFSWVHTLARRREMGKKTPFGKSEDRKWSLECLHGYRSCLVYQEPECWVFFTGTRKLFNWSCFCPSLEKIYFTTIMKNKRGTDVHH